MRIAVSSLAWDVADDEAVAAVLNAHGVDAVDLVPGKYFAGGAVTYSPRAVRGLLDLTFDELRAKGIRSSSEPYAEILAETIRQKHGGVAWGLSETGAAGPHGNGYGDPAGHTCIAVAGRMHAVRTVRTGISDRVENMWLFTEAALALLVENLESAT